MFHNQFYFRDVTRKSYEWKKLKQTGSEMSGDTPRGGAGAGKVPHSLFSGQQSQLSRKVSDAALYGFNRPQEVEEMKPEREPLQIYDETIPDGECEV